MTDRERFERIVSMSPFEQNCARYPNNEKSAWPGNYRAYQVQLCWDVCQAYAKPLRAEIDDLKLKLEASDAAFLAIRKELIDSARKIEALLRSTDGMSTHAIKEQHIQWNAGVNAALKILRGEQ